MAFVFGKNARPKHYNRCVSSRTIATVASKLLSYNLARHLIVVLG